MEFKNRKKTGSRKRHAFDFNTKKTNKCLSIVLKEDELSSITECKGQKFEFLGTAPKKNIQVIF